MLLISVFFVSLSALAFEILLARVFSIGQWNHLSFMVISIALFGFSASGTFLSLVEIRRKNWLMRLASPNTVGILLDIYAFTAILSFLAVNHLPLDYFRIPVEPGQIFYLLAAYLMLALPFFFSGLIISLAYITVPEKTGLVYFSAMTGSALGAFIPAFLLQLLGEGNLVVIAATSAVAPGLLRFGGRLRIDSKGQRRLRRLGSGCSLAILISATALLVAGNAGPIQIKPSPYKALSQVLQFPDTHIVGTSYGIRGRIDQVDSPYIRFAPGLSLKYMGELPRQRAIFRDGDDPYVIYDLKLQPNALRFAEYMISYSGYILQPNPEMVLLTGSSGGSAIACAAVSGARQILILEPSLQTAEILRRGYSYPVINQNPRTYLARSSQTYDIIHVENWGNSVPGAAALNQNHSFTIEAFIEYWNHLTPTGVVIVSRKLLLPPSDTLRLWSSAYESLMRAGIETPENHLAMLRNFDTFTLLISKAPVNFKSLVEFAGGRDFDLVFLPNLKPELVNRFNIFDKPFHYEAIKRLAEMYRAGRADDFFDSYFLDVAPQSDRRPCPGKFLKWSQMSTLYQSLGKRFYALFMSGEIVVAVILGEALVVSLLLLVLPLMFFTRRSRKPALSQAAYFFAVGVGFMLVEIYFIKRFVLLVGDPVVSFTLVLAGILLFSGLAGIWVYHRKPLQLRLALVILLFVLTLEFAALELFGRQILKLSETLQYAVVLFFLLLAGISMGLPFPLGMRCLLNTPVQRAYAWSVNGCASVLAAIAAAQVAISYGIPQIAGLAVGAYLIAFCCVRPEKA